MRYRNQPSRSAIAISHRDCPLRVCYVFAQTGLTYAGSSCILVANVGDGSKRESCGPREYGRRAAILVDVDVDVDVDGLAFSALRLGRVENDLRLGSVEDPPGVVESPDSLFQLVAAVGEGGDEGGPACKGTVETVLK